MSESVAIIIQARMGSSRLPGKVLMDLAGRSMLAHIIERAGECTLADSVWVATTDLEDDDRVVELADVCGVNVFRGSAENLLERYYGAAQKAGADIIVRYTADDPFKDSELTDQMIEKMLMDPELDYICNFNPPTWPEGLDLEAFRFSALRLAREKASTPFEFEHINPFFLNDQNVFKTMNIPCDRDMPHIRLTVDYPQDMELAKAVYAELYHGKSFGCKRIVELSYRDPQLFAINNQIERGLKIESTEVEQGE